MIPWTAAAAAAKWCNCVNEDWSSSILRCEHTCFGNESGAGIEVRKKANRSTGYLLLLSPTDQMRDVWWLRSVRNGRWISFFFLRIHKTLIPEYVTTMKCNGGSSLLVQVRWGIVYDTCGFPSSSSTGEDAFTNIYFPDFLTWSSGTKTTNASQADERWMVKRQEILSRPVFQDALRAAVRPVVAVEAQIFPFNWRMLLLFPLLSFKW